MKDKKSFEKERKRHSRDNVCKGVTGVKKKRGKKNFDTLVRKKKKRGISSRKKQRNISKLPKETTEKKRNGEGGGEESLQGRAQQPIVNAFLQTVQLCSAKTASISKTSQKRERESLWQQGDPPVTGNNPQNN